MEGFHGECSHSPKESRSGHIASSAQPWPALRTRFAQLAGIRRLYLHFCSSHPDSITTLSSPRRSKRSAKIPKKKSAQRQPSWARQSKTKRSEFFFPSGISFDALLTLETCFARNAQGHGLQRSSSITAAFNNDLRALLFYRLCS